MSIKGTFILEHPHVKAIFGRKDPQKALPYPERCHLTYFA